MRLSHITQLVLNPLHIWKVGCGTSISNTAFSGDGGSISFLQRNSSLVFPFRSWYIPYVEKLERRDEVIDCLPCQPKEAILPLPLSVAGWLLW